MDLYDLPTITNQQNDFVKSYVLNGLNGSEAYRMAYNSSAKTSTCCVEASRLLKNPKIALWLDFYRQTMKEHIEQEIKYTVDDAFKEYDDLKIIALESVDQYGRPNVAAANKAVEMKCRLKNLMADDSAINNSVVVQMGKVEVDGNALELEVGDEPKGIEKENNISSDTSNDS